MKTVLRTILYPFALCETDMLLYVRNDMFVSILCIFQIAINLNLSIYLFLFQMQFFKLKLVTSSLEME